MKPIRVGDVVGDYRVIEAAGSGGMGEVFKIEHVITKRIEAMKLLPPASSSDPEQVQRFEREIQVQARLHHPNIVALYNAVRESSCIGLVMEFVEGESLQTKLQAGALPIATAVDYTYQVLRALAYAHEAGVIHRDVAPANMIVTPDGVLKLMDFGLARGETDLRLSATGVPIGSPWYMSPEQVKAIGPMDARTDIYATGAVFHEMLTGTKLFDVEGAFSVMRAHVEAVPVPPSTRNAAIPVALDAIVAKAVAKDPAMRFQSADEFRLALQDAVAPPRHAIVLETPARAADVKMTPVGWLRDFHPSRAAVAMVLVPVALVAGFVRLMPQAKPVHAPAIPPAAMPAPRPTPLPLATVEPTAPPPAEVVKPVEATPPRTQTAKSARRASAQPNFGIRITGGDPAPAPVAAAVVKPEPSREVATAPEAPVVESAKAADETSVAPPPDPDAHSAEEAAPPKASTVGSRLVRALGKVNPFHKGGAKPATPSKTPLRKD
ncbi:MAG: serine/threonine protein kinase [Candidatus Solibacter sp.]|nr:serine/threonine protein kinase [Candidatus Solibacter sp.]